MTVGQGSPQVERFATRHSRSNARTVVATAGPRSSRDALRCSVRLFRRILTVNVILLTLTALAQAQDPIDGALRERLESTDPTGIVAETNSNTNTNPASQTTNAATAQASTANAARLRLEVSVVWGGGTPRTFAGEIAVDSGSIEVVRNLSVQSDAIGAVANADARLIKLQAHAPSSFGGCDLKIEGTPKAD